MDLSAPHAAGWVETTKYNRKQLNMREYENLEQLNIKEKNNNLEQLNITENKNLDQLNITERKNHNLIVLLWSSMLRKKRKRQVFPNITAANSG